MTPDSSLNPDELQATLERLEQQLRVSSLTLSANQRIILAECARKLLCLLNSLDPTCNQDAVSSLSSVRSELAGLKDTLSKCPEDLVDATKKLIQLFETMLNGTLFAGTSSYSHTILMQGSVPAVDVHSLLKEMKPYLELAMEVAGSPQTRLLNEIHSLKLNNEKMIINTDKIIMSNEKTLVTLQEQNALLRAQLTKHEAETKSDKDRAQYRHLAYDLVSHVERVYAFENDSPPFSLYEGCFKHHTYDLAQTEKAFGLPLDVKHKGLSALTLSIKEVKDQRFLFGHSTPEVQKETRLSQMKDILESHFRLTAHQRSLYDKIVTYGMNKINEKRKEKDLEVMTKDSLSVADIMALQDYE